MKYFKFLLLLFFYQMPILASNKFKSVEEIPFIYYELTPKQIALDDINTDSIPSIDIMYTIAKEYIPENATFFIAIKMEESGADNQNSFLAKEYNNLIGMRYPRNRETYSIASTNTNYSIYRNWFECMLDFNLYMENIENSFKKKHKRGFKNDYEKLDYLFNFYNGFEKWYNDMVFLIRYTNKKYVK
jgi:hypothetical protein